MPSADDRRLDHWQRLAFAYFREEVDPATGLVADHSGDGAPCSIAAVGFALTAWPIGVERGWMPRAEALRLALAAARFFARGAQGDGPHCVGERGFFYHFLGMADGRRHFACEVSTIDTSLLLAGLLSVAAYFEGDAADERELRALVEGIHRRVDWRWALDHDGDDADAPALAHGWTPERGVIPYRWRGWTEATLLHALALGSPTSPVPAASYAAAARDYRWVAYDGIEYLHAAPLFIHQYSHLWLDLADVADPFLAARGSDFAENTRRATLAQSRYAARNPGGFAGYSARGWGFTAGEGPDGGRYPGYHARGAPFGDDDGTIAPWAVAASLPFAPDLCLETLDALAARDPALIGRYGFVAAANESRGWRSQRWFGIDNGPIVIAIENLRSGLPWRLMRGAPALADGLRAMGCRGGRLDREARLAG